MRLEYTLGSLTYNTGGSWVKFTPDFTGVYALASGTGEPTGFGEGDEITLSYGNSDAIFFDNHYNYICTIAGLGNQIPVVYDMKNGYLQKRTLADGNFTVYALDHEYALHFASSGNMKEITISQMSGAPTVVDEFPFNTVVNADTTILMAGKDSPVITVDYLNTQEPVITDS